MKKIAISLFILVAINASLEAQSASEELAGKIAQKMKDSLSLTGIQYDHVYAINMGLSNFKSSVRQQYATSDSLGSKIQRIENTRDSLYNSILTEQQFLLYRQKKNNLVNGN